jgi:hypothetical protein
MRKTDRGLLRFCEKIDHGFENSDPFLPKKISERLFIAVHKAYVGDSGLFLQLTNGRLLCVFTGFDMALGKVPVA